jgi:ANTAR domain
MEPVTLTRRAGEGRRYRTKTSRLQGSYRSSPGRLSYAHFGDGLILADAATVLLLDGLGDGAAESSDGNSGMLGGQPPDLTQPRAEVDQATGMVMVQLGVPPAEAFVRLWAYAYAQDRRLAEVAGEYRRPALAVVP